MRLKSGNQNTTLIDIMASPQIMMTQFHMKRLIPYLSLTNGLINVTLKPHQIVNINRAEKLERYEEIKVKDLITVLKLKLVCCVIK